VAYYATMWDARIEEAARFEALIYPTGEPPASASDSEEEEEAAAPALGSSERAQSGSPAAAEPAESPEEGPPEEDWNILVAFPPKATAG
jgi:hypothetical protein